jgi:hypothetical protein
MATHQKTAKYCLEIQGNDHCNFDCDYCKKSFRVKQTLIDHLTICKEKAKHEFAFALQYENQTLKNQIDELKKQNISQKEEYEEKIKQYEAKLEKFENAVISVAEASKQPTITYTTHNTNSNNGNHQINNNHQILNLSPEAVEPLLRDKLTFDVAKQGQKGLASFVLNNMLRGPDGLKYKCKDTARQNFEYINKHGDVEKDVRAKKLSQALIDSKVETIATEVSKDAWRDDNEKYVRYSGKVMEIVTLSSDDTTFRNELTALTS